MNCRRVQIALTLFLPVSAFPQGNVIVDPNELFNALGDDWPTYSGDYTGQRHSSLTQIDKQSVKNLTLAWSVEMNYSVRGEGGFSPFGGGSGIVTHIGGEGDGRIDVTGGSIKGSVLEVDGILYVTAPITGRLTASRLTWRRSH